ncbi:hypothetical protein [Paracoccus alkenifer]|uniref:hypothetical protein n=1 Tax=Paracoccus alkenifer TaxID=65735 RepID=UPI0015A599D4|nr:hypothetical protein [Paracoccus alkenifer]
MEKEAPARAIDADGRARVGAASIFIMKISPPEASVVPQAGMVAISELLGRKRHHRRGA